MSAFGDPNVADLLRGLAQSMESLTEAVRGQTDTVEQAGERSARAAGGGGSSIGGLLGQAFAGAGGVPGVLGAAGQLAGASTAFGSAAGGLANVASATAAGAAVGGPAGGVAAGGLAGLQSAQQFAETERSFELQLVDAANPSTNPVVANQIRRRVDIERDPRTAAGDVARSRFTAAGLGGVVGAPAVGRLLGGLAGEDPRVSNREREISEEPSVRAAARLQAEVRQITSQGGQVNQDFLDARGEFLLQAEQNVREGDVLVRDWFKNRPGDRTGQSDR